MAKSTIRGIRSIVSRAFEAAMRWEWTDCNPARSAKPPTPSRHTVLATSPEAVAKVIAEARARSAALGLYVWLVVVTGVRRGELCGLQIGDMDLDRALVQLGSATSSAAAAPLVMAPRPTRTAGWPSTRPPVR